MPLSAAPQPDAEKRLPPPLAEQVALIASQLAPGAVMQGEVLLRLVDAGILNICEIAEVDFALMNRALALRTAAERFAQLVDGPRRFDYAEREEARLHAEGELVALEGVLHEVKPSAVTKAMGVGW
jgi:hypothetical protein